MRRWLGAAFATAVAIATAAPAPAAVNVRDIGIRFPDVALAGMSQGAAVYVNSGGISARGAQGFPVLLVPSGVRARSRTAVWAAGGFAASLVNVAREMENDALALVVTPYGNRPPPGCGTATCTENAELLPKGTLWACFPAREIGAAPVAVDGDVVAVGAVPGCEGETGASVFDLSGGGVQARTGVASGARVTALALAGRALAYATATSVSVVDRTTLAPLARFVLPGGRPGSIALGADGTLAVITGPARPRDRCDGRAVRVYAPGDTAGRDVSTSACDFGLALAGADILAYRPFGAGRIELVRLSAAGATPIARMPAGPRERRGDDRLGFPPSAVAPRVFSDGTSVAYEALGCAPAARIALQPLAEPPSLSSPSSCPVRLSRMRAARRGFPVKVVASCPNGCDGELAWASTTVKDRRFRNADSGEPVKLVVPRGGRKTLTWDGSTELSDLDIAPACSRPGRRVRLTLSAAGAADQTVTGIVRCRGRGSSEPVVNESG